MEGRSELFVKVSEKGRAKERKRGSLTFFEIVAPTLKAEKTVKFQPFTTVLQALQIISSKFLLKDPAPEVKWCLYNPRAMGGVGLYMENVSSFLHAYGIQSGSAIELRRPPISLSVMDSSSGKSLLVKIDLDQPVGEALLRACFTHGRKHTDKYCLALSPSSSPLSIVRTLRAQAIDARSTLFLVKKGKKVKVKAEDADKRRQKFQFQSDVAVEWVKQAHDQAAKEQNVRFGVPLEEALRRDRDLTLSTHSSGTVSGSVNASESARTEGPILSIPYVISDSIAFLENRSRTSEFFRRFGSEREYLQIRGLYDSGMGSVSLVSQTANAHVVCDVLLSYLDELPEPLIPYEKTSEFFSLTHSLDDSLSVTSLSPLLLSLPSPNYWCIKRLTELIVKIISTTPEELRRSAEQDLCAIFSPLLFGKREETTRNLDYTVPAMHKITSFLFMNGMELFTKLLEAKESEENANFLLVAFEYTPTQEGEEEGELKMSVGDIIKVIEENESGWWSGELEGKRGTFPVTYCEEIETKEALSRIRSKKLAKSPSPSPLTSLSLCPSSSLPSLHDSSIHSNPSDGFEDENECKAIETFDESDGSVNTFEMEQDELAEMDVEELRNLVRKERALRMALQDILIQKGDFKPSDLP